MTLDWLWTDWLPVENDPGVAPTATIHWLGGWTVEAIDVLSDLRWSQELVTSAVNGRLAIKDLLEEDYPIFPRIASPWRSRTAQ